jgi:hypothetical protein
MTLLTSAVADLILIYRRGAPPPRAMRSPRRAPAYLHGLPAWGPTPTRDALAPQGSRISSRFTGVGPHPHARCARPEGLPHIFTITERS